MELLSGLSTALSGLARATPFADTASGTSPKSPSTAAKLSFNGRSTADAARPGSVTDVLSTAVDGGDLVGERHEAQRSGRVPVEDLERPAPEPVATGAGLQVGHGVRARTVGLDDPGDVRRRHVAGVPRGVGRQRGRRHRHRCGGHGAAQQHDVAGRTVRCGTTSAAGLHRPAPRQPGQQDLRAGRHGKGGGRGVERRRIGVDVDVHHLLGRLVDLARWCVRGRVPGLHARVGRRRVAGEHGVAEQHQVRPVDEEVAHSGRLRLDRDHERRPGDRRPGAVRDRGGQGDGRTGGDVEGELDEAFTARSGSQHGEDALQHGRGD